MIDSRAALGVGRSKEIGRAVITPVDDHHYAIMVDALEDVTPFAANPLTDGIALDRTWAGVGLGFVEREGEPILIIDAARLIAGLEMAE